MVACPSLCRAFCPAVFSSGKSTPPIPIYTPSEATSIPVITLGSDGFGGRKDPVDEEAALGLIRRAVDLGVNHVDTARCYGDSLMKLGMAIRQGVVKREELIINGRICCHGSGRWGTSAKGDGEYAAEKADYSAARVLPDIEDQLDVLGIGKFDALLIHGPWPVDPTLASGGTLEGLETARDRGWVDFIGYGMHHPSFHLEAIASGRIDVLLTYADYNLLNQDAANGVLPAAAHADIGVLNAWSIREGLLTGVPVQTQLPQRKWERRHHRAESIRVWCEKRGVRYCIRCQRYLAGAWLRWSGLYGVPERTMA